jgi:VanZ family protein
MQLRWLAALGLLGTALEYGQLFIPTRWFEWQDIALSLAGLATTWVAVEGYRWIIRRLSAHARGRRAFLR